MNSEVDSVPGFVAGGDKTWHTILSPIAMARDWGEG